MTPDTPDQRGQPTEQEVLVKNLRAWAIALRNTAKSSNTERLVVVLEQAAEEIKRLSQAAELVPGELDEAQWQVLAERLAGARPPVGEERIAKQRALFERAAKLKGPPSQ